MKYLFLLFFVFLSNLSAELIEKNDKFSYVKSLVHEQKINNLMAFLDNNQIDKNQIKELINLNVYNLLNFDVNKKLNVKNLIDTNFANSIQVTKEYQKNNYKIFELLISKISNDEKYLYEVLENLLKNTSVIIDLSFYDLLINKYKLDANYLYQANQTALILIVKNNTFCEKFFSNSFSKNNDENIEAKLKEANIFINSFNNTNIYNAIMFFIKNGINLAIKDVRGMTAFEYTNKQINFCSDIGFKPIFINYDTNIDNFDISKIKNKKYLYNIFLTILDTHNDEVLPFTKDILKK